MCVCVCVCVCAFVCVRAYVHALCVPLPHMQCIWMPGSRSELAVVSDTFVKIYDLALDAICPQYCFIVMSGKVKDATFVVNKQVGGAGPGVGGA